MDRKPFYHQCARRALLNDHFCGILSKIDWEHAIINAGKQVNEEWAIVPICYWAHRGEGLVKEINVWIALNRATDDTLRAYSKARNYVRERDNLNETYGDPRPLLEKIGGMP